MFGQNPIRKQTLVPRGKLWVQSVFHTLQGEGPFSGESALFIRLAGCNLQCFFCDTDFESSSWKPGLEELLVSVEEELAKAPHTKLIVLTGGEPFRQNITPLVNCLLEKGLRVQIETAGTLSLDDFPFGADNLSIVCSPKTGKLHSDMAAATHWKYVIFDDIDPTDGLPVWSTQIPGRKQRLARPLNNNPIWVMPCDLGDDEKNRKQLHLATSSALQFGHRLGVQLHKLAQID